MIVCYKVVDLTISCLRSLEAEAAAVPGIKVAVCENGTGRNSVERLRQAIDENGWGEWVELSWVMPNRGFTGGNNFVIGHALEHDKPDYVLLLNADTEIYPGAFRKLIEFMDAHPRAGVAGSQLVSPDGQVQTSLFRFEGIATHLHRAMGMKLVTRLLRRWVMPLPHDQARQGDWVAGASLIARREVFEQIGLLDEGFYTYYDDIDFCLNAHRAGWEIWYVPASRVMHLEGSSTGIRTMTPKRRPSYWFAARRRYFLKNYGPIYAACIDVAFIFGLAVWKIRRRLGGKQDWFAPSFLSDIARNSVFAKGFKVKDVENPAMKDAPMICSSRENGELCK